MDIELQHIELQLPHADLKLLKELAHKMGWVCSMKKKSSLDIALDDYKAGRVYKANNVDDLMQKLLD